MKWRKKLNDWLNENEIYVDLILFALIGTLAWLYLASKRNKNYKIVKAGVVGYLISPIA